MERLVNLRNLLNHGTKVLCKVPKGFKKLTGLQTLHGFYAGKDWSKLGYLKKLDQLSGSLALIIRLRDEKDVSEARKAKLTNKIHIQKLKILFNDGTGRTDEEKLLRNEALEALQPPPNLRDLEISDYKGTKFPSWMSSCLNHLRVLEIQECNYMSTLPCLGKLPELEELSLWRMKELKYVGREFLGVAAGDADRSMKWSSVAIMAFPKLKKLSFYDCPRWEKWEDITAEEAGSATVSIMPCLRELKISYCGLRELPHRLLGKAPSLEELRLDYSFHLWEHYGEKGADRRSLSHIPRLSVGYLWHWQANTL
ncbi:UNVERIFIED_CONTAM: hypothetical protein Slati_3343700 [Sesamum latifolium]|uniref:R13L1/DRL21-like LRR repeat region domain-containing protein n=1 Tax=Sesamum latifolium TaxID=2727402 RepID=A0AAW2UED1_9LAMI